jgi:DinB superfamily
MRELEQLEIQLERLGALLTEEPDATPLRVAGVSAWSVAEQVDHVLNVLDAGLGRLDGELVPLPRGINLTGRLLLGVGRLPRGVGKSPEPVRGESRPRAELVTRLVAVRVRLRGLGTQTEIWRDRRPLVRHPYFRGLTPRQGVRFLAIHTDHHLRIVADIRRAS